VFGAQDSFVEIAWKSFLYIHTYKLKFLKLIVVHVFLCIIDLQRLHFFFFIIFSFSSFLIDAWFNEMEI